MKHLRNTRRGWMIFHAPDNGGAAGGGAEPPPEPPQAGDATSKSIFAQEMAKVSPDAPPAAPEPPPTPPAEPPPAAPDADDKSKTANRDSKIPADVLDPSAPAATKVHDDVAELLAAELPKGAKKEQIDSFHKIKTKSAEKLQAALDRAAELERELETTKKSGAALTELEEKLTAERTRAAEIEEQFAKVAFKESPKFKAQFADREQTALDLAKSYLDGTEIKAGIIDLAAHATGRKRIELLKDAGVDDATIQLLSPHLANFDTIQREKQAALNNWQITAKQEREEASAQAERLAKAKAEQENRIFDKVVPELDLLPFRKSKDNTEWNARAEQLLAEARRVYNGEGATHEDFAKTVAKGVAYDVQQEVLDHLRTENATLRTENAALKSAAPGGQITSGTQDGTPVDTSKMPAQERWKSTFNSEKAKVGAA